MEDVTLPFPAPYWQYYRSTYVSKIDDSLKQWHSEDFFCVVKIYMKYV